MDAWRSYEICTFLASGYKRQILEDPLKFVYIWNYGYKSWMLEDPIKLYISKTLVTKVGCLKTL